ncbi:hypothetical protein FUAX_07840 [Fulvitalea axinellae]|uniref:HTH LytTR-type domain-containing protein n=1 Tax=Fulvitalea axinellae TaxID=1182444 RepID=A0AAU9CKC0_9BACT|nr:hypothetical protein FUAX_07840 [Fulvitalea axinellae]
MAISERPFPELFLSLGCGFYLFFVLYFYKAYNIQLGVSFSGHSHLERSLAIGLETFLIFYLLERYLSPALRLDAFWQKLLWRGAETFVGANFCFVLFNYFWHWTEWDWPGYTLLLREYAMAMIVPLLVFGVLKENLQIKKQQKTAPENQNLNIKASNGKVELALRPDDFFYAKAEDNYLRIFYRGEKGTEIHMLRRTMKSMEDELAPETGMVRCHRSYLANPKQVRKIVREKGAWFAVLDGGNSIPVSKSRLKDLGVKTTENIRHS